VCRGGPFALEPPTLKDKAAAAIGAVDCAFAFHIEKDPGVAERPFAAVAGDNLLIDG